MKNTTKIWYLDSGCSKHVTGDKIQFSSIVIKSKGYIAYEDSNKGNSLGIGKVGTPPFITIDDVIYVEGLKHNLISISQLCDKGLKINFTNNQFIIEDEITIK